MSRSSLLVAVLAMACSSSAPPPSAESPAGGSTPQDAGGSSSVSVSVGERGGLVHGGFDADGSRVVAAWLVPPRNRAGTDGTTGVTVWDLGTGEHVELPGAGAPVALSPDGGTVLAMMPIQPAQASRGAGLYDVAPALVELGDPSAPQWLDMPTGAPPSTSRRPALLAVAFAASGDEVLGLTREGALLRWSTARGGPPSEVARLPESAGTVSWHTAALVVAPSGEVMLTGMPSELDPKEPRLYVATWGVDASAALSARAAQLQPVANGLPASSSGAPLGVVVREVESTTTTIEPSGKETVEHHRVPVVEPAFVARTPERRLVDEPGGWLRVELDGAPAFSLVPGQSATSAERR